MPDNTDIHREYLKLRVRRDQMDATFLKTLLDMPGWDVIRANVSELSTSWVKSDNAMMQITGFLLQMGIQHAQGLLLDHNYHDLRLAEEDYGTELL